MRSCKFDRMKLTNNKVTLAGSNLRLTSHEANIMRMDDTPSTNTSTNTFNQDVMGMLDCKVIPTSTGTRNHNTMSVFKGEYIIRSLATCSSNCMPVVDSEATFMVEVEEFTFTCDRDRMSMLHTERSSGTLSTRIID